jgi:hypothetical protein
MGESCSGEDWFSETAAGRSCLLLSGRDFIGMSLADERVRVEGAVHGHFSILLSWLCSLWFRL